MRRALLLPLALLAGCGKAPPAKPDLDALDRELVDVAAGNGADPATTAALRDQIMVDPALVQSANARAVRPAPRPDAGAMPPDDLGRPADTARPADLRPTPAATPGCPGCTAAKGALTLGALAERQRVPGIAACAPSIRYATGWANRLPPTLPLYPDAMVVEAAGSDAGGCALRVVSFTSAATLSRVSDWFYAHASRGGFAVGHRADGAEHLLAGHRGGGGFALYLRPRAGGGTEADLVSNVAP